MTQSYLVDVTIHRPLTLTVRVLADAEEDALARAQKAAIARALDGYPHDDFNVVHVDDAALTGNFKPETTRIECYLVSVEEAQ